MKKLMLVLWLGVSLALISCSSVTVAVDYDREVDFSQYITYGYYKPGLDAIQISDLDKRRILKNIDAELDAKGMVKSDNPQIIINIFTEEQENVNVYQDNFGWGMGWGWGWGWGMPMTTVNRSVEGTLFIDFIDLNKNRLVWQGIGTGILSLEMEKKEERIQEIVRKILQRYPPK